MWVEFLLTSLTHIAYPVTCTPPCPALQTQVEALYSSLTSAMHSIRPPSGASSAPNSGAAHRALPPPPSELSHLVLHEVMGRGGGGVVLRATQWGLECAVKVRVRVRMRVRSCMASVLGVTSL